MDINMKDVLSEELSLPSTLTESYNTGYTKVSSIPNYNYFLYLNVIKNNCSEIEEQLNSFEMICNKESSKERLVNATRALCEAVRNKITKEIVPSTKRVRNGESTDHMNRHKIGTAVKAKITKLKTATGASATPNTSGGATPSKPENKSKEETQKEATIMQCLDKILDTCNKSEICYTIIDNQKKLNKRFDFNKYAQNNSYDIEECVHGLCDFIDTYDIPYGTKYKVALENIQYTFYKNSIDCDKKTILESVTDYFLLTPEKLTENHITDLKNTLKKVNGYSENDINSLFIMKENTNNDYMNEFMNSDVLDLSNDFINNLITESENKAKDKKGEVKKLIDEFKMIPKKTPEALRSLIYKIYTKDPNDIIDGTPNLLGCIRFLAILGGFSAGIIPGLVVLCADYAIKLTLSRKQVKKLISQYNKELSKAEKKLEKLKDEKAKARTEEYKESLEDAIYKLEDYEDNLHQENEEIFKDKDDDKDDEDDINFESSILNSIDDVISISEKVDKISDIDNNFIDMAIANCAHKMDDECIITFTNISTCKPDIINPNKLKNVFDKRLKELRNTENRNYMLIDTINSSIWDLEHNTIKKEEKCCDAKTVKEDLDLIYNIADCLSNTSYVNEVSITNTLKLASINLKKGIKSLSDKEKILSRNIDASVDSTIKAAERSMQKGNREAVIKGQLIPSASKVIKGAIMTGAAWLINPAVAVIGLLGTIACSKKAQAKERQLILDEIETELKICEKQIKIAEDKDDMKAYKNLLMTQRSLERQHQRIRYKMKVDWGQAAQTHTSDLGRMTTTMKN